MEAQVSQSAYPSSSLVGRREALQAVDEVLEHSAAGAFRFLALTGEPGVGKSRLLSELAAAATARKLPVLSGRASEFEREMPFGVVVDALDDLIEEQLPELAPALSPATAQQLAKVFPALSVESPGGPGGATAETGESIGLARYRLYTAVRRLIERLASPDGLVLLLDDLHWADDSSIELLDHLVRHPPRAGILTAVACRPAQGTPGLSSLVHAATDHGRRLTVGPLTLTETTQFLGSNVSRARCRDLHRASGGNPFYLEALVRVDLDSPSDDHEALPLNVQSALQAELKGLPDSVLLVARAAAIAADEFEPALVATAAKVTEEQALAALDQLTARDVVRPAATGRFGFRHPLVRHAIYDSAAAGWRLAVHARIAGHLAQIGAPATQRAHHVERSARFGDQTAINTLVEAARTVAPHAPSTAAHWLQSALLITPQDSPERLRFMLELAQAQSVSGRLEEGRQTARETLRLLPPTDYSRRAYAARFCAITERLLGRTDQSRALLLEELRAIPDQQSGIAVHLQLRLVAESLLRLDHQSAQARLDRIPGRPDLREPGVAVAVALLRPMCAYASGLVDEALGHIKTAAHVIASAPDEHLVDCVDSLTWLCWTESLMGLHADALRHFDRMLAVAQSTGQQFIVAVGLAGQAFAHIGLGRLDQAGRLADDATESARLLGSPQQSVFALTQRCLVNGWSGETDAALAAGEEAVRAAGGSGEWWSKQAEYALALALINAGRRDDARELLLTACNGFGFPTLDQNTLVHCAEQLAALEAAGGRPEESARWADQAGRHAYPSLPGTVGLARLAQAHASLEHEPDRAAAHAREAAALLDEADLRLDVGRAMLTAGVADARAQDRDSARQVLQTAAHLLNECGAGLLYRRAVQEQRRLGVYVPAATGRTASPYGLSRRELEVATLVARGYTNLQIAEALVISVRTVETHLSHIFAKLGVTSRASVVTALNPAT